MVWGGAREALCAMRRLLTQTRPGGKMTRVLGELGNQARPLSSPQTLFAMPRSYSGPFENIVKR